MTERQTISCFTANPRATRDTPPQPLRDWLGRSAPEEVRHLLNLCPQHQVTPLKRLDCLAQELGLASIFAKDEGGRLGLGSFKALGGAYAVAELVLRWATERLGRSVMPAEIMSVEVREAVKNRTICCATDGNHGRSVAAGARLFGCKAVIFVHQNVEDSRRALLRALNAQVVEVSGTYDDSVDMCADAARENGWQLVSDTSWKSESDVPARVMQGYTVLVDEALSQMNQSPTHVFVQGGVGGLAGAVAGHLADLFGKARPTVVVVEPDRAGCLIASALAGRPVEVPASDPTVMAMLECYRPSEVAWPILDRYVDAFMTIPDTAAIDIVKVLANPSGTDPVIAAGISGGVGLAGLVAAAQEPHIREALGLDHHSRILTIITERADTPAANQTTVTSI
ncbi:diaminopropionate ammonia-lyase [Sphingorhabdus sp.]|uniref:diaminopropionate ammonia-lyase n=1 Tax=Sphingorhabdus sp. TaxID=1902408 RepID=UPI0032B8047C